MEFDCRLGRGAGAPQEKVVAHASLELRPDCRGPGCKTPYSPGVFLATDAAEADRGYFVVGWRSQAGGGAGVDAVEVPIAASNDAIGFPELGILELRPGIGAKPGVDPLEDVAGHVERTIRAGA